MIEFHRDSDGIQKVLSSPQMSAGLAAVAEKIATNVRRQKPDADVVVDSFTTRGGRITGRAAASVAIRDIRARIWQVRDGILTRAAATEGLEVNERA